MSKRKPISKRTRFEVFKRDGFCCQYCGEAPPKVLLEVDHVVPVCEGGGDDMTNLLTACFECNRGKSGVSLEAIPKSLSDIGAEVREREEQLAAYREVTLARAERIEHEAWEVVAVFLPGETSIRRDWLLSIKKFVELMPVHLVIEAAEIARARKPFASDSLRFKYFCGVCWNMIKGGK